MKTALVFLFIVSFAISARSEKGYSAFDSISPEPKSKFALLDDVRILANGLLQLGHGLKDFVQKTKGQINDIFRKLNIFDKSFYELSQQTNEIKEEEEELRKTTSVLQVNNEEIRNISLELISRIENFMQEKIQLQEKVGELEKKVAKLVHGQPVIQESKEITSLKSFVERQDNHIRQLLKIVQDQLDKQHSETAELEDKLNNTGFQENIETAFSWKQAKPQTMPTPSPNAMATKQEFGGVATDCTAIYNTGEHSSGIYTIKPNGSETFSVYCEMKLDRPWTVIQRRSNGSQDFNQTWGSYVNGFGDLHGEFWLGLNKVYSIAKQADNILRIELEDWKSNKRYIEYTFTLGSPETDYALYLSEISGNIPNALTKETEMKFSTMDHGDNIQRDSTCPENYSGGWWHTGCGETNLNGKYTKPRSNGKLERRKGLYWKPHKGRFYLLKSTKLMIHPTDLESFD